MALSDQLMDLASRIKQLEDAAEATRERNRAKLEQEREKLHTSMERDAENMRSSAEQAQTDMRSWWADTTSHMEQQRADLRSKIEQRRAEHEVARAQRNAEDAEQFASDWVAWAAYAVDNAEYAVLDAAIARGEADELAAARTPTSGQE